MMVDSEAHKRVPPEIQMKYSSSLIPLLSPFLLLLPPLLYSFFLFVYFPALLSLPSSRSPPLSLFFFSFSLPSFPSLAFFFFVLLPLSPPRACVAVVSCFVPAASFFFARPSAAAGAPSVAPVVSSLFSPPPWLVRVVTSFTGLCLIWRVRVSGPRRSSVFVRPRLLRAMNLEVYTPANDMSPGNGQGPTTTTKALGRTAMS
ncbi:hypothetical protein NHX12_018367 [Muraenolepis orangiensis]|uniref:Transmembrane protein n=1 Tax=Muraenolepis orangiensis TaxID=630683 RepID=A0A9Q0EW98_9TELE|nr:hypothetical protein NHX12_018367 [Muraenolepis orangiensis]